MAREDRSKEGSPSSWHDDDACRSAMTYGWTAVALFLILGVVLEALHLFKAPLYLEAHLRRELWTLAHAHGTLLGLLSIAFALTARRAVVRASLRLRASRLLRAGAILVPLGFFLGGVGNSEGDPSPAIFLTVVGAILVLLAVATVAGSLLRRNRP